MRVGFYIIRFLLALLFIWAGVEKLFLPYDPSVFRANSLDSNPMFFEFYDLLQNAGYLYFVGFLQLLCGILMIFKRTYLLGSVMLVPLIMCLLMTHVFFSKNTFYMVFDTSLFCLNALLIAQQWKQLKAVLIQKQQGWI